MTKTLPDVLATLDRSGTVLDAAFRETAGDPARRAARLTAALLELWPAPVCACLLRHGGEHLAVLDEQGAPRPDWEAALRDELARRCDGGGAGGLSPAPRSTLPSGPVLAATIGFEGRHYGALAAASPSRSDDLAEAATRSVLTRCADRLALLCALEERGATSPEEADRLAWLNNLAEVTSIVTHEFNNCLNGILLHLAVIKPDIPPAVHPELDVIRGLGTNAAGLVKRVQQYNSKFRPPMQPLAVNAALADAVRRWQAAGHSPVPRLEPADGLPPVLAAPPVLDRLLHLLWTHCAAAMGPGAGALTLRTERGKHRVQVRIEDTGPAIADDHLGKAFEPFVAARPGGDELSLAICHTLARRMQGSLAVENRKEGGVRYTLELTPAPQ